MTNTRSVDRIWTGELEYVQCHLCGSSSNSTLVAFDDSWRVAKCADCGLSFVNPRPSEADLAAKYKEWGESDNESDIARIQASTMPPLRAEVKRIVRALGTGGTSLDVGSGAGFFVKMMKDAGWNALGVEPSEAFADYAARQFGVDTVVGTIENADLPENGFDVVTMWYVLEHVMDPRRVVNRARSLLKPGGLLIIRVPNVIFAKPFLLARKCGFNVSNLGVFTVPWHLYFFSASTLSRLMTSSGFRIVHVDHGRPYLSQHVVYNAVKGLVTATSEGLRRISLGRLFWGPTMVVRAAKG